jgi:hypothetical protein
LGRATRQARGVGYCNGGVEMSVRLNNWKTQLKAEKSIQKIYQRDFNAAWRKLSKSMALTKKLEDKVATYLAKIK